jgi:hypothetical protein
LKRPSRVRARRVRPYDVLRPGSSSSSCVSSTKPDFRLLLLSLCCSARSCACSLSLGSAHAEWCACQRARARRAGKVAVASPSRQLLFTASRQGRWPPSRAPAGCYLMLCTHPMPDSGPRFSSENGFGPRFRDPGVSESACRARTWSWSPGHTTLNSMSFSPISKRI